MAKDRNKPDMGWIRGALRGEVQKKLDEAEDAEQAGDPQQAANLRRIAVEWYKVHQDSDPNKPEGDDK